MTPQTALEFIDDRVFAATGRHLSDLERLVFLGAWQGQTYQAMYPANPGYAERSVGYQLWRKLSQVLGEKVTKKRLQGAIARAYQQQVSFAASERASVPPSRRWVIGYPDALAAQAVARSLRQQLEAQGQEVFSLSLATVQVEADQAPTWSSQRLQTVLADCDGVIVLVAAHLSFSDWIVQTLRSLRSPAATNPFSRPQVFAVRLAVPPFSPVQPKLCAGLQGTRQWDWQSEQDTQPIVRDVLQQVV